jgi:hypothetical protein
VFLNVLFGQALPVEELLASRTLCHLADLVSEQFVVRSWTPLIRALLGLNFTPRLALSQMLIHPLIQLLKLPFLHRQTQIAPDIMVLDQIDSILQNDPAVNASPAF